MQAATSQSQKGLSPEIDYPNAKDLLPSQAKNCIGSEPIRNALHAIAELRKYILTEHPSLLKEAGPSLVRAEVQVFDIWGKLAQ